jgi:lipoprotein-anchoring transpeptidase ErfK/SrfK
MKGQKMLVVLPILFLALSIVLPVSADYTYTIQPGDTLFRIALNHGLTTQELAAANGIINHSMIYAGQTLIIPEESNPSTFQAAASTLHLVAPGDTLFKIAVRYGLSTHAVAQANNIENYDLVFTGQTLIIPNSGVEGGSAFSNSFEATVSQPVIVNSGTVEGERWIDVNLSTQMLTAYEGSQAVMSTAISSGAWPYLTVTGEFEVYIRYQSQDMNGYRLGYDYYLEDVPYVMYFYKDFALHGTYWHNNFGTPMSHGCVNLTIAGAQWLFNWSGYGTMVNIHY